MNKLIKGGTGSSMYLSQIVDSITGQSDLIPKIVTEDTLNIQFPDYGDKVYLLQFNQDCNITIKNVPRLQFQKLTLILQQPINGNCYPTFVNEIEWKDGKKPFVSIEAGKETILEIIGFNNKLKGKKIYG
ncbi:hypothetical protein HK18_01170 [Commensalibacter intestini]|uniref:Uncharacterized protein n=2 Tax=Commensalibacter intestini TaxID=479936 RepID=A0A251ZT02_9PROT|nr:hypothetical protein [Commensalibacter intestini]OUI77781.1 hypothetical protein HK18_01170 [Commensalibacter intestini]